MSPPCHFYSIPFSWNSVIGSLSNIKSPFLTRPIKIHTLKFWYKVYEIDPFFYVFVYAQISSLFHIHKTHRAQFKAENVEHLKS